MNIFITGAGGFIGSHLKEFLSAKYPNYNLFCPSSQVLDLSNENELDSFINKRKIDCIIHLANRGGSRDSLDLQDIAEYNLRIFFNIFKQCNKVNKILSFGSGAEYGKHKPIINAKESDYLQALPLDSYGFYKNITSRWIENTANNIIQLRIFGAYGEYENYRYKFISNAIVKNLLKLPISIYKNVYFDYIYIADLLNIIDYFIHNNAQEKIYNATSGEKIDLLSLANIINEISEYKSEIILLNEGLNNEYSSNNDKLKNEIPSLELTPHKKAITKMAEFFSKNLQSLDLQTIQQDPFIHKIKNIWGGGGRIPHSLKKCNNACICP